MTVSTLPSGWIVSCSFGSSLTAQIGEKVTEPGSEWPLLRQCVGRLHDSLKGRAALIVTPRPHGSCAPHQPICFRPLSAHFFEN
jgi:hypothetical protein